MVSPKVPTFAASIIFFMIMANMQHSKSATRGPKTQSTVGLGSEYPVCREAQMLIDVLENNIDESSHVYVKECFQGFTLEVQRMMAESLMNALIGRLYGDGDLMLTGLHVVDDVLLGLLHTLVEEMENPD